jgi:hypothetical protein
MKIGKQTKRCISKTLNLVYWDQWNVVEDWYIPNEEFIYFYDKQDLENKIRDILGNWDEYTYIIDNAYRKVMQYTTEKFIKEIQ